MGHVNSMADRIRRGDPISLPLALALNACTPAVRLGMWRRAHMPRHWVDAHVVSFGNITAGGTGKTPAVIERARAELANGRRVAVLTRGYGAPAGRTPCDSPELAGRSAYEALGDEAALILQKAPDVIILKDADRVAAARRAIEMYGCDLLILDDGFQQLRLERDENVMMIDATNPFGNGHLVPRGILREPPTALARATDIIVTYADRAPNLDALLTRLRELAPRTPIRLTRHAPVAVRDLTASELLPLDWLSNRDVDVACAIANPQGFVDTLAALGAHPRRITTAPDHTRLNLQGGESDRPLLITEKDAARLDSPFPQLTYALEIELRDVSVPAAPLTSS